MTPALRTVLLSRTRGFTFNPAETASGITLAPGGLTAIRTGASSFSHSRVNASSPLRDFGVRWIAGPSLGHPALAVAGATLTNFPGRPSANGIYVDASDGKIYHNADTYTGASLGALAAGDAVDAALHWNGSAWESWWRKNGSPWIGASGAAGNPETYATPLLPTLTVPASALFPAAGVFSQGNSLTVDLNARVSPNYPPFNLVGT